MLRKFSTKFGKSRKDEVNTVNGTNGTTSSNGIQTNGIQTNGSYINGAETNGTSSEKPGPTKRGSSFGFASKKSKAQAPAMIADHAASRTEVESAFAEYAQLIHASRQPLPDQQGHGVDVDHEQHSGLVSDVKALGFKDVQTLMDVMKNKATGDLQDDHTYLMEKTIQVSLAHQLTFGAILMPSQLVAKLPSHSKTRVDLTNAFIDELWNSLQHPPMSYLGNQFQYRSADGSGNVSLSVCYFKNRY